MAAGPAILDSPARAALRQAAVALDLAEQQHIPIEMCLALAQVGRCYRALQALEPAEWYLTQSFRWACLLGSADQPLELLCHLAEVAWALAEHHRSSDPAASHAALERTRDRAFEAAALAARVSDAAWEINVLLRISDLLDRCGDHADAVELQARALRLIYCHHAAPDGPAPNSAGVC